MLTTPKGINYPEGGDDVSAYPPVASELALWVDDRPGVAVVTASQMLALGAPDNWAGKVVFNSSTGTLYAMQASGLWQPTTTIAVLTTTARNLLASGELYVGRLIYNTTTAQLETWDGANWQAPQHPAIPAQQAASLIAHHLLTNTTFTIGPITIPVGGAGTWSLKNKIAVVGDTGIPTGASMTLLIGGNPYEVSSPVRQPTDANGLMTIDVDVAGLTAGELITLEYSNPSGSGQGMTFAASAVQGDGGSNWSTATFMHAP